MPIIKFLNYPTGGEYSGILKRYNGSSWEKTTLKVYLSGSWQNKPLKVYIDSEWKLVDTTGV